MLAQYLRTAGRGVLDAAAIELCGGVKWLSNGARS